MAEIDENAIHHIHSLTARTRRYWPTKYGHCNFYYEEESKEIHMERQWDIFVGQKVRYIQGLAAGLYNAPILCHKGFCLFGHFKKY